MRLGWVGSSFAEPTGGMRTGGWWSVVVLNGVNDRLLNCIFEFSTLVVFAKLNEIILLAYLAWGWLHFLVVSGSSCVF